MFLIKNKWEERKIFWLLLASLNPSLSSHDIIKAGSVHQVLRCGVYLAATQWWSITLAFLWKIQAKPRFSPAVSSNPACRLECGVRQVTFLRVLLLDSTSISLDFIYKYTETSMPPEPIYGLHSHKSCIWFVNRLLFFTHYGLKIVLIVHYGLLAASCFIGDHCWQLLPAL